MGQEVSQTSPTPPGPRVSRMSQLSPLSSPLVAARWQAMGGAGALSPQVQHHSRLMAQPRDVGVAGVAPPRPPPLQLSLLTLPRPWGCPDVPPPPIPPSAIFTAKAEGFMRHLLWCYRITSEEKSRASWRPEVCLEPSDLHWFSRSLLNGLQYLAMIERRV